MKEYTVTYTLTEDQEDKLNQLIKLLEKESPNTTFTKEKVFETIMILGSRYKIDEELKHHLEYYSKNC